MHASEKGVGMCFYRIFGNPKNKTKLLPEPEIEPINPDDLRQSIVVIDQKLTKIIRLLSKVSDQVDDVDFDIWAKP